MADEELKQIRRRKRGKFLSEKLWRENNEPMAPYMKGGKLDVKGAQKAHSEGKISDREFFIVASYNQSRFPNAKVASARNFKRMSKYFMNHAMENKGKYANYNEFKIGLVHKMDKDVAHNRMLQEYYDDNMIERNSVTGLGTTANLDANLNATYGATALLMPGRSISLMDSFPMEPLQRIDGRSFDDYADFDNDKFFAAETGDTADPIEGVTTTWTDEVSMNNAVLSFSSLYLLKSNARPDSVKISEIQEWASRSVMKTYTDAFFAFNRVVRGPINADTFCSSQDLTHYINNNSVDIKIQGVTQNGSNKKVESKIRYMDEASDWATRKNGVPDFGDLDALVGEFEDSQPNRTLDSPGVMIMDRPMYRHFQALARENKIVNGFNNGYYDPSGKLTQIIDPAMGFNSYGGLRIMVPPNYKDNRTNKGLFTNTDAGFTGTRDILCLNTVEGFYETSTPEVIDFSNNAANLQAFKDVIVISQYRYTKSKTLAGNVSLRGLCVAEKHARSFTS